MPTTTKQSDDKRDEKKRQKWQADYEDAIDLREANEKQLEAQDNDKDETGE